MSTTYRRKTKKSSKASRKRRESRSLGESVKRVRSAGFEEVMMFIIAKAIKREVILKSFFYDKLEKYLVKPSFKTWSLLKLC